MRGEGECYLAFVSVRKVHTSSEQVLNCSETASAIDHDGEKEWAWLLEQFPTHLCVKALPSFKLWDQPQLKGVRPDTKSRNTNRWRRKCLWTNGLNVRWQTEHKTLPCYLRVGEREQPSKHSPCHREKPPAKGRVQHLTPGIWTRNKHLTPWSSKYIEPTLRES